ncbi:MAG: hypothetical protein YHS30scaffold667_54 [Phage 65_10]|nr:MAG: hypothetical protein YHS30scaffold667_54 [Phage 65_10]
MPGRRGGGVAKYPCLFARLVANTEPMDADTFNADDCWVWTGAGHKYPRINMWLNGKHRSLMAHRVMLELSLGLAPGTLPSSIEADHSCWRRACINPAHLNPKTHRGNLASRRVGPTKLPAGKFSLPPRGVDFVPWAC